MKYTPKENMLRVFRQEIPEGLPHLLMSGTHFLAPQNGFHERPAGGKGGTDWFGVKWSYIEGDLAPVPDSSTPPICDDITEWKTQIRFPDMDAWDWEKAAEVDGVANLDREHKMIYTSSLNGFFERMHTLLGFEDALCSLLMEPEATEEFLDAMLEFKCKQLTKIHQYYNPDVMNFHDDYGTQRGMFFSPALWRSMFAPRLKQVVDHCHSLGMIFELHSCGKIDDIVPDIAACGVDCLQCMDIVDVARWKKELDGQMSFGVSPNFQKFASGLACGSMTTDDVRQEAYAEFMELAEGGCYYPFINPPLTPMNEAIWNAHLQADADIRKQQGV